MFIAQGFLGVRKVVNNYITLLLIIVFMSIDSLDLLFVRKFNIVQMSYYSLGFALLSFFILTVISIFQKIKERKVPSNNRSVGDVSLVYDEREKGSLRTMIGLEIKEKEINMVNEKIYIMESFNCSFRIPSYISRISENISEIFPAYSLSYVLFVTIVIGVHTFLKLIIRNRGIKFTFYTGFDLMSGFFYPEKEHFAALISSEFNGSSRMFYNILTFLPYVVVLICYDKFGNYYYWEPMGIGINFEKSKRLVAFLCSFFYYFSPFLRISFLNRPDFTCHYLIESINRYLFGVNGSYSLLHSCFLFLRSAMACFAVYMIYKSNLKHRLTFAVASCLFVIHVKFYNRTLRVLTNICYIIIPIVLSIIFEFSVKNQSVNIVKYICYSSCVFYIFLQRSRVLSIYNFLFIRIFKGVQFYKYFNHSFKQIIGLVYGSCIILYIIKLQFEDDHKWLIKSITTVVLFNNLISSQSAFGSGIFAFVYFLCEESLDLSISIFIGFALSKKLHLIYDTVKSYAYAFAGFLATLQSSDEAALYPIIFLIVPKFFSPINFGSFVFGITFGSYGLIPYGRPCFMSIPVPPRANNSFDPFLSIMRKKHRIKSFISEYPSEAPVYLSMVRDIKKNLHKLINDGAFGFVTEESFYLLHNDSSNAIIHILGIDGNDVYFQLRGLEVNSVTLCHDNENAKLSFASSSVVDINNLVCSYEYLSFDTKLSNLRVSLVSMKEVFESTNPAINIINCLKYSLSYYICKNRSVFQSFFLDSSHNCEESLRVIFVIFVPDACDHELAKFSYIFHAIAKKINSSIRSCTNMFKLFNSNSLSNIYFDSKIDSNEKLVDEIVFPSLKATIILFYLEYSSLIQMDVNSVSEFEENLTLYNYMSIEDPSFEKLVNDDEIDCFITVLQKKSKEDDKIHFATFSGSNDETWKVFRLSTYYMKSLWGTSTFSTLDHLANNERTHIQATPYLLNNLMSQAADLPIGYPAYVSDIENSSYYLFK